MRLKSVLFRSLTLLTVSVLAAAGGGCGGTQDAGGGKSYLGRRVPELPAGGAWLNSSGPVTLAGLRGKVVWLEFGFLD